MSDATRPDDPSKAAPLASPPRAAFEFSEDGRDAIRALAASMSFVGVCLMLFGGLLGVFAAVSLSAGFPWVAVGLVAVASVYVPTAWWTMSGGRSLSAIVRTRGRDIDHLTEAVGQLRRLFAFARGVIIFQTLLLTAIGSIFVWCTLLADKGDRCLGAFG
jgi:hypothetical protein